MEEYYENYSQELDKKIRQKKMEIENPIVQAQELIEMLLDCLKELRDFVQKRGFKSVEEEIHFFKYQKPTIFSKLIYYNAIYKIEAKKPYGGKQELENYFNNELIELKRFYDRNIGFCKYYRTNSTYLDNKIFVRGQYDIKLGLDTFFFESDPKFSTSHDYKVAKIIANDLIQVYLEDQLNGAHRSKALVTAPLNWTRSKRSLIELIYALHSYGAFGNGCTDIKVIAKTLERTFNINLGDFYHTYLEVKGRKINRTKFLDNLREALIKKMDEQEEI